MSGEAGPTGAPDPAPADTPADAFAPTTLATVAADAGVSVPTVSRVLNGKGQVASITRRRVEEALQRHGYRRRGRPPASSELDLVFPELEDFWALPVIRGVERYAATQGLHVVLTEAHGPDRAGATWLDDLVERQPLGVILMFSPENAERVLQARGVPVVVLHPIDEPGRAVVSIGSANWGGGRAAAEHLLGLGHERIAVITGPRRAVSGRARIDGFTAAMAGAGLNLDPALVVEGSWHVEAGYHAGLTLLGRDDPPTAVFAGNDLQALGLYRAAGELGVAVPRDISVVGYDDLPAASWMSPPLTTVRQPLEAMAAAAARLVVGLAGGEEPLSRRFELSTELVVRESTCPPGTHPRTR